jgi:hypothetical protein
VTHRTTIKKEVSLSEHLQLTERSDVSSHVRRSQNAIDTIPFAVQIACDRGHDLDSSSHQLNDDEGQANLRTFDIHSITEEEQQVRGLSVTLCFLPIQRQILQVLD